MIPLKSRFHRSAAVLAGAVIGLAGVVTFAAPASAHHSELDASYVCETATGEWVVDWTVKSVAPADVPSFKLIQAEVAPVGSTITGIAVTPNNVDPTLAYPHDAKTSLTGEQRLAGTETSASLTVKAEWSNGQKDAEPKSKTVTFEGTCTKDVPKPSASFASDCKGVVVVTLNNIDGKAPAELTVTGKGGFKETKTLKPGEKDVTVTVPADNADEVKVTEKGSKEPVATGGWTEPEGCIPPGEPELTYETTCDELILTAINPKDGEEFTIVATPTKGDAKNLVSKPGTTTSVSFPAGEGFKVNLSVEGDDEVVKTLAWEKPTGEVCDKPEGGQAGGEEDEPTLPLTGPAVGGIAGGAAVLLAIGGGLFFMARRRKLKFTA